MHRMSVIAVAAAMSASATQASGDWLVLPGMEIASHEDAWRKACSVFVLTDKDNEENYLTCNLANGDAATANVTPAGIVWWAGYQDASGGPRDAFVKRVLEHFSITTPGQTCDVYGDPAECWSLGALSIAIETQPRADRWLLSMEDRTIFDPDAPGSK